SDYNDQMFLIVDKNKLNYSYVLITTDEIWTRAALAPCSVLKLIASYLLVVYIFGLLLNGFVLHLFCKEKHLRNPTNIYLICLCATDFIGALLEIPLPLTSNFACTVSLNKYYMIVKPLSRNILTMRTTFISVALSIFGGLFWSLTPLIGWSSYTLEGVLTSCSITWQSRTVNVISYNISLFIFGYFLPLLVVIYLSASYTPAVLKKSVFKPEMMIQLVQYEFITSL
ncbi:unnamed protein product, partial [Didymodactylos carnosus]